MTADAAERTCVWPAPLLVPALLRCLDVVVVRAADFTIFQVVVPDSVGASEVCDVFLLGE